jgi:hypothetical protein
MNNINYNRLLEQFNTINHDFNKLINKYDQNDFNLKNEIKKLKELNETLKKKYKDKNYDEIKSNEISKKDNEDKNNEINILNKELQKDNEKFKKDNELLKKENEDKNKEINELKNKLKDNELLIKENEELKNKLKENESLKKYEDKNNINNNLNISDQTNYNLLISNTSSSNINDSKINDYKNVTPNYSCYINSDNDLVIEIELVGFKNCKLSYEIINNEFYNFHIIAEKENDEIEKKMIIQNKRFNENIDYIIKIPIDSFTLSESKPYFKKFEKGLITFKYKLLNNSSSISIKFNDINIPK